MKEIAKHAGIFHVWDVVPGWDMSHLRDWLARGNAFYSIPGIGAPCVVKNILMATQKTAMANAVYPTIDHLVITSQTNPPSDSETGYTGVLYETDSSIEINRSEEGNPFVVGWKIPVDDANGTWGSFILVNSDGDMINRALAGVTKTSGQEKWVVFTGSVTS